MFQVIDGIPVWGQHDANTIEQIKSCAKDANHAAPMGDGHLRYAVPIDPVTLRVDSALGEQYLRGMELAGRYPYRIPSNRALGSTTRQGMKAGTHPPARSLPERKGLSSRHTSVSWPGRKLSYADRRGGGTRQSPSTGRCQVQRGFRPIPSAAVTGIRI